MEKSSTFVVDLTSLKHPDDVMKDMYGCWDYSSSHPEVVALHLTSLMMSKSRSVHLGLQVRMRTIFVIRSSHTSNCAFRKMIAFVHGKFAEVL